MAELSVCRKSIKDLLSLIDTSSKGKIFVIQEYQLLAGALFHALPKVYFSPTAMSLPD
jgi:hypothetical protein